MSTRTLGGNPGSREPSQSALSRPVGFDPGRVTAAREAWSRVMNMDGGRPQVAAAALWADTYADMLLNALQEVA